ncbi:hypothetical protein ACFL0H_15230, partial [Thermodesulfobacteriota bacterium]
SSRAAQVVPLMALSKVEGRRCLRSLLSFDLGAFGPELKAGGLTTGLRRLASNTLLVSRVEPKSVVITTDM